MRLRKDWKIALGDTVPVMAGYLVLGMGFGLNMDARGYSMGQALAMSIFIFAGSMQYAAVDLFASGASLITVALTTLAVNARHLFYGISMIDQYKNAGARKPYLMFALTDETYSLVVNSAHGTDYALRVSMLDQLYWVVGTILGVALGSALHFPSRGVEFSLTALFITVFTDQWLTNKDHFPALTGVLGALICLLIFGQNDFLIPAMIVIAAALLARMRREDAHDKQ